MIFFKEGTKKEERSVELVEAARCEFSYKETLEFCDFASVRFILTIQWLSTVVKLNFQCYKKYLWGNFKW